MSNSINNGRVVNFVEQGSGPSVILIHGIAASLHSWAYLLPALASKDYHTLALDLLGHGESAKPKMPEAYHVNNLFAHLETWISSLALAAPIILVGHSLGGYLAMRFALQQPNQVGALVLVNPIYTLEQVSSQLRLSLTVPELSALALRMTPQWMIRSAINWAVSTARPVSPAMREQVALDYKRADPFILHIAPTIADLRPQLHQINQPSLVIWGSRDLTLSPASFPDLVSSLPNATGRRFQACGHVPHLCQSRRFNQLVINYLDHLSIG